jgi:DNA-binding Lrp family transcriptional regulator
MTQSEFRNEILRLLGENGRISLKEISARLNRAEEDVASAIKALEDDGIIIGYRAVYDESKLPENAVKAIIEVKTRPQREGGFDHIAKRISKFPEVSSVYLVSGGFDLLLEIKGENLNAVAQFVSSKLATMEGVISTATHFLLKKYKESGKLMQEEEEHERLKVTP